MPKPDAITSGVGLQLPQSPQPPSQNQSEGGPTSSLQKRAAGAQEYQGRLNEYRQQQSQQGFGGFLQGAWHRFRDMSWWQQGLTVLAGAGGTYGAARGYRMVSFLAKGGQARKLIGPKLVRELQTSYRKFHQALNHLEQLEDKYHHALREARIGGYEKPEGGFGDSLLIRFSNATLDGGTRAKARQVARLEEQLRTAQDCLDEAFVNYVDTYHQANVSKQENRARELYDRLQSMPNSSAKGVPEAREIAALEYDQALRNLQQAQELRNTHWKSLEEGLLDMQAWIDDDTHPLDRIQGPDRLDWDIYEKILEIVPGYTPKHEGKGIIYGAGEWTFPERANPFAKLLRRLWPGSEAPNWQRQGLVRIDEAAAGRQGYKRQSDHRPPDISHVQIVPNGQTWALPTE